MSRRLIGILTDPSGTPLAGWTLILDARRNSAPTVPLGSRESVVLDGSGAYDLLIGDGLYQALITAPGDTVQRRLGLFLVAPGTDIDVLTLIGLYTPAGSPGIDGSAAVSAHVALTDPHTQYATDADLSGHTGNTSNPHSVTKAQVGLGSADNTADASKPVSTAQQTALNAKQDTSGKDASGGYAGLTLLKLNLRNAANTITSFFTTAATVARTWTLPDKDGTVAMTSDITGTNSGTNTGDQNDHGLMAGLADDDHPQYALLAGRAGGQTFTGGTAASNTLTLSSTSHATKGKILLGTSAYDEVNNWLGLGIATPLYPGHIAGSSATEFTGLLISNTVAPTLNALTSLLFKTNNGTLGLQAKISAITDSVAAGSRSTGIIFATEMQPTVGATEKARISGSGRVSIGPASSPTAFLHIRAGAATASSAPLKFTTGTLLTTPEVGAMEYNNTLWFTASDAVRRAIVLSSGTYTGGAVAVGGTVQVNINGTNYNMLVQ